MTEDYDYVLSTLERWVRGAAVLMYLVSAVALMDRDAFWTRSFAVGAALILLYSMVEGYDSGDDSRLCRLFTVTSVMVGPSYWLLALGIKQAARSGSNFPGIGTLAVPFYWFSMVILSFGTLVWVLRALGRKLRGRR